MASRLLTVVDNDRLLMRVEFWEGLAFIHADFRRRVAGMRETMAAFPQLKRWLKGMGHGHCYVCIDPADRMLHRFERRFGFRDMCMFFGFLIMAQET